MIWHCVGCGKRFPNRLKQARKAPNGRILYICPICGFKRVELIK